MDTETIQEALERLWTVKKVAERYRVTPMTVHNWRKRGLPTVTIRGDQRPSIRFVPNDVRRWRQAAAIAA